MKLYTKAAEFRRMAVTATTVADAQALERLAVRFTAVAKQKQAQESGLPAVPPGTMVA